MSQPDDQATDPIVIDARDLPCPIPVLKARRVLAAAAPGDVVEVRTTDPAAPADFRGFCKATGHRLMSIDEAGDRAAGGEAVIRIIRAG